MHRELCLNNYSQYGLLDRNEAIDKIIELRKNNPEIMVAEVAVQNAYGSAPLESLNNDTLITNIQYQIKILCAKLADKALKNARDSSESNQSVFVQNYTYSNPTK